MILQQAYIPVVSQCLPVPSLVHCLPRDGKFSLYQNQSDIEIIKLKPEKDDTDTEAAVCFAAKKGIKEIDILGATGSRFDHAYACIKIKIRYIVLEAF